MQWIGVRRVERSGGLWGRGADDLKVLTSSGPKRVVQITGNTIRETG